MPRVARPLSAPSEVAGLAWGAMSAQSSSRSRIRLLATAAAAFLVAAGIAVAAPAHAHDELISSDPAAGTTLEAMPAALTLTFSGEISPEPGATELAVTDAAGTSLADGEPEIEGTVVTQPLVDDASGAITVLWKVVSSDGHPISGELSFTVDAPVTPEPTASPEPTETVAPTPTAEREETTAAPVAPPTDEGSSAGAVWPWVVGGLLLIAVAGAVVYLLVSRARRDNALAGGSVATDGSGAGNASTTDGPVGTDQ